MLQGSFKGVVISILDRADFTLIYAKPSIFLYVTLAYRDRQKYEMIWIAD